MAATGRAAYTAAMARCAGGGSGGRNAVAGSKLARDLDVFKDLKVACDL
jgi:hypothetical protein